MSQKVFRVLIIIAIALTSISIITKLINLL